MRADCLELEVFRAMVSRRLGLHFAEGMLDPLPDVLESRLQATRAATFDAYRAHLDMPGAGAQEWRLLATALTIGETYFFRHEDHFRAFGEAVLPAVRRAGRSIRVLSAGCASGEEAYSLAIRVAEHAPGAEVEILGLDLNPTFVARARQARYSPWSLRGLSPAAIRRYFEHDGQVAVLREPYRRAVCFEERNLLDDDPAFWQPGTFDVIFCRNVSIYFDPPTTERLMARFAQVLTPGGFLFMGPAESLRGRCEMFQLVSSHDTFYYRRETAEAPKPIANETWVEAIERSVGRIAALPVPPAGPEPAAWDRSSVLSLFAAERFAEALDLLNRVPPGSEALLLKAAALTTMGRLTEAETTCQAVLSQQPHSPGALYLWALCRDQAGDAAAARRHNTRAAALDPHFAMPRLHLGLLAARHGDWDAACRELRAALPLLATEAEERLVLFGGGFGRAALEALCRAELTRLEAHA